MSADLYPEIATPFNGQFHLLNRIMTTDLEVISMAIRFVVQQPTEVSFTLRDLYRAVHRHLLLFAFYARAYRSRFISSRHIDDDEPVPDRYQSCPEYHTYSLLDPIKPLKAEMPADDIFAYQDVLISCLHDQKRRLPLTQELEEPIWDGEKYQGDVDVWDEAGWKLIQPGPEVLEKSTRVLLRMIAVIRIDKPNGWFAEKQISLIEELVRPPNRKPRGNWATIAGIEYDYPIKLTEALYDLKDKIVMEETEQKVREARKSLGDKPALGAGGSSTIPNSTSPPAGMIDNVEQTAIKETQQSEQSPAATGLRAEPESDVESHPQPTVESNPANATTPSPINPPRKRWYKADWYSKRTDGGLNAGLLSRAKSDGRINCEKRHGRNYYELESVCSVYSEYRLKLEAPEEATKTTNETAPKPTKAHQSLLNRKS